MRISSGMAGRSLLVVLAALLASCSNASQGLQTTPFGTGGLQARAHMTPLQFLELQAAGKLPAPVPPAIVRRQLELLASRPRPSLNFGRKTAGVAIWVTDTADNYLVGLDATVKKMVADINVEANNCYFPSTVKVDGSQNIWVACDTNDDFTGSLVQEYGSQGSLLETYNAACPAPVSACESFFAESDDEATDSRHVFLGLSYYTLETSSGTTTGSGFEWWPAKSPSATPTLIALPYKDPVESVYYMDLDTSGNIWFDYAGVTSLGQVGYGLAEITSPTKNPTFVSILPIGSIIDGGGVNVSDHGKVLNVTDLGERLTKQYKLPLAPSGSPFNILGPTRVNRWGFGEPVTGGFNKSETKLVFADLYNWLDVGTVSTNKWSTKQNTSIIQPEGAAYTPSDR
jgi:hypothetical protein